MHLFIQESGNYIYKTGMVSDNAKHIMLTLDQFYTNGLMLFYRLFPPIRVAPEKFIAGYEQSLRRFSDVIRFH